MIRFFVINACKVYPISKDVSYSYSFVSSKLHFNSSFGLSNSSIKHQLSPSSLISVIQSKVYPFFKSGVSSMPDLIKLHLKKWKIALY